MADSTNKIGKKITFVVFLAGAVGLLLASGILPDVRPLFPADKQVARFNAGVQRCSPVYKLKPDQNACWGAVGKRDKNFQYTVHYYKNEKEVDERLFPRSKAPNSLDAGSIDSLIVCSTGRKGSVMVVRTYATCEWSWPF